VAGAFGLELVALVFALAPIARLADSFMLNHFWNGERRRPVDASRAVGCSAQLRGARNEESG